MVTVAKKIIKKTGLAKTTEVKRVVKALPIVKAKSAIKAMPVAKAAPVAKAKSVTKVSPAVKAKKVVQTKPAEKIKPIVVAKVSASAATNKNATNKLMITKEKKSTASISSELITEAVLVKMSEKDYMSKSQLDFFKEKLARLREDILKNADTTTENLRDNILVPDPADRATIEEEHALELRTRDRERKLLKKVEQALARIESGDYGWCEETGEAIGVARLLARPTANLSLEAQERRELRQKLFGD